MNILIKFIEQHVSGIKILALFILTNLVYLFMLTITIPLTMRFSDGMRLLDMMPTGYDLIYVNELFKALGENGRDVYLNQQLPVDMIYPLLFGFTYCLLLAYLLTKINKLRTPFVYLCIIPVLAGVSDYLENIGIITLLNNYPNISYISVKITNIFSIVKSISTSLFFVILIIILILYGLRIIKKKYLSDNKLIT